MKDKIMSVSINSRIEEATHVQEVLTKKGSIIKTRLGIHDAVGSSNTNHGLLLLHLQGNENEIEALHHDLNAIGDVNANMMDAY